MDNISRRGLIESEAIATAIAKACIEKKGSDLAIFDMRGLVAYTDMFVVCSANNRRHVQAIAQDLRAIAKRDLGIEVRSTEGMTAGRWVLVDLIDVVVHIFDTELRGFYDLDGLWSDAPRLALPEDASAEAVTTPQYPLP